MDSGGQREEMATGVWTVMLPESVEDLLVDHGTKTEVLRENWRKMEFPGRDKENKKICLN